MLLWYPKKSISLKLRMSFSLPKLPYSSDSLEPYISKETILVHYEKHHKGYVTNLNKFVKNDISLDNLSLEELMHKTHNNKKYTAIFNNAAQVWNHSFYWQSITKNGGTQLISESLMNRINDDFGDFNKFREKFINISMSQFGSGWVWLVLNKNNSLEIISTSNASNPLIVGLKPLLTCDVWEHAYYIDYHNRRLEYVNNFIDNLADWTFVDKNILL
jgi:Fe-Mn family superoxide dismutase